MRTVTRRRHVLWGGVTLLLFLDFRLCHPSAAQERSSGTETGQFDAARFLRFALSSAVMQERASGLAASRDTRPEVQAFASEMNQFRKQQVERLRVIVQERGLRLPTETELEHRVLLENLEPLDSLELSRRYAEVQVQALEQEVRGYTAAAQAAEASLRNLVAASLPQLRQHLLAAQQMRKAVEP